MKSESEIRQEILRIKQRLIKLNAAADDCMSQSHLSVLDFEIVGLRDRKEALEWVMEGSK